MYPARSSTAFLGSGWRSVSSSSQPKSYYLTQQEQIGGRSVSGAFQNWCELRPRVRSHVISCQHVCVCVWGGLDLLAQFVLSLSSELENVLMNSPSSLSPSFCRIGREWNVSLSYSGWPWLWFAVSLNIDATHHSLIIIFQHKSCTFNLLVILFHHQNLISRQRLLEKYDICSKGNIIKISGSAASA